MVVREHKASTPPGPAAASGPLAASGPVTAMLTQWWAPIHTPTLSDRQLVQGFDTSNMKNQLWEVYAYDVSAGGVTGLGGDMESSQEHFSSCKMHKPPFEAKQPLDNGIINAGLLLWRLKEQNGIRDGGHLHLCHLLLHLCGCTDAPDEFQNVMKLLHYVNFAVICPLSVDYGCVYESSWRHVWWVPRDCVPFRVLV